MKRYIRFFTRIVPLLLVAALILTFAAPAFAEGSGTPHQKSSIRSHYLAVQSNPNLADEQKIANAIDTYFKLRYEGQRLLQPQDFSWLVFDSPKARSWASKEQDKRDIELFVASTYRLNYVKYDYSLDYEDINVKDREATVRLQESHSVIFEVMAPEISKLAGLEHVITLRKTNVGWVIVSDEYQDDLMRAMKYETKEELIDHVRSNRKAELELARRFKESDARERNPESIESGAWHSYDRGAARTYADTWGNWNDPDHHRNQRFNDYENIGGDCTNFASQVIYAGAPQMDHTGGYLHQWFNDGNWVHSATWTAVSPLYDYLTNNTGTGPYGNNSSMCNMVWGDVVQLYGIPPGHTSPSWAHSVVVVSSHSPQRCWDPSYIWVNAHSADVHHYPLSNYSWATSMRYISIGGWRD